MVISNSLTIGLIIVTWESAKTMLISNKVILFFINVL